MNKIIISGFAGSNAETKTLNNGTNVSSFSVATSKNRKDQNGNWISDTTWHNVECFAYLSDKAQKINKGSLVTVSGELRIDRPKDENGNTRTYVKIIADTMEVVEVVKSQQGQPNQAPNNNNYNQQGQPSQAPQNNNHNQQGRPNQAPQNNNYNQQGRPNQAPQRAPEENFNNSEIPF